MFRFFYDETEHSRKINYETVTAQNYCDNFISAIVGWSSEETEIIERYLEFENKYAYRKIDGELKSQTMKTKDFRLGFSSLTKHTIDFYDDLISVYDEGIYIYFSVFSKIEYVIHQLFMDYHNNMFVDVDFMKYSIIKAINVYRPHKVIEAIYKGPQTFVDELRSFLESQISKNQDDLTLKKCENEAFEEILVVLNEVKVPKTLEWVYFAPFDGFEKFLAEMKVSDYRLVIDREGDASHTLNSAKTVGLNNVTEGDSRDFVGIRMADMLAGLISRLMQSLRLALIGNYQSGEIKKTLLEPGWFALNQRQLELYKKLYRVICKKNDYWYKTYAGIYSDDLVSFVALLQFMNHFTNVEELRCRLDMQPEYYNAFVCDKLSERYNIMQNKLPLKPIEYGEEDFFLNERGAKIYWDIKKQPMLELKEGKNQYHVLAVGIFHDGNPLVTIDENGFPVCYKLPGGYNDWAMTVVGMANMGESIFPTDVIFSVVSGKYYVDFS